MIGRIYFKSIALFKRHWLFITILLLFFTAYIFYLRRTTADIPYMDTIRHIELYVRDFFNGTLSLGDLWRAQMEHRLFGQIIFFLINVNFFHLNTLVEVYGCAVFILISCVVAYLTYYKFFSREFDQNQNYKYYFPLIIVLLFSWNQWELITLSISSSIFFRIILLLITFAMADNIVSSNYQKKSVFYLLFSLVLTFLILGFAGGSYPAVIISLFLILLLGIILKKNNRKNSKIWMIFGVLTFLFFILVFLYMYNIGEGNVATYTSTSERLMGIINIFTKDFVNAVKFGLLYFAGSFVSITIFAERTPLIISMLIGAIVVLFYALGIFLFIKIKLYKKTIYPILLILYNFLMMAMIMLARLSFGYQYAMSSRYTTDSVLGLIGLLWIFIYYIESKRKITKKKSEQIIVALSYTIMITILLSQATIYLEEWRMGPYRKHNFQYLQQIALNIDNYSDDQLAPFQANAKQVRIAVAIMKEYQLSVFRNNN